jgi:hypothetical protein
MKKHRQAFQYSSFLKSAKEPFCRNQVYQNVLEDDLVSFVGSFHLVDARVRTVISPGHEFSRGAAGVCPKSRARFPRLQEYQGKCVCPIRISIVQD